MAVAVTVKLFMVVVFVTYLDCVFSGSYDETQAQFEKCVYTGEFIDGKLDNLPVKVLHGDGTVPTIKEAASRNLFEVVELNSEKDVYIVKSRDQITWKNKKDAIFTLEIGVNSAIETVVIVKTQSESEEEQPRFDKLSYSKKLENGLLKDLSVTVLNSKGTVPSIKETAMREFFQVVKPKEDQDDVYIVQSIDDIEWSGKKDAIFTLEVGVGSKIEAVVIVETEEISDEQLPRFDKSSYSKKLENGLLKDLSVTVLNSKGTVPSIKETAMREFFQVVKPKEDQDDVYIVQSIDDIEWSSKKDAIFTLQVVDGSNIEAVVIVKTEEISDEQLPRFDQSSYSKDLENGQLKDLSVTVLNSKGVKPSIKETAMQELFEVVIPNSDQDDVYIVQSIAGKEWTSKKDAIFTLEVGAGSAIETVVIVQWKEEDQTQPRFEKLDYTGTYKNGELIFPKEIKLEGGGQGDVRFGDEEMEKIFKVQMDTNGLVTITKTGAIKPDLEEILLIVIAERGGLEGSTAVLIKIDADSAPTFDKSSYEGVYDGDNFIVDEIKLANYLSGKVVVESTEEGYDKYFIAKIDNENKVVTIGKTDDFEKLDKSCVWLTLQLIDSNVVLAKASVFLTLAKESGSSPKFDSCFYQAAYDGDKLYVDLIQVENPDNVEIELSDPAQEDLVKVTFVDGRVALEKLAGLDEYTGDQLIVKIKIKTKQRDTSEEEAILVLTIKKRDDKTPYFKTAYKLVEYDSSKSSLASLEVVKGEYGNVKLVEQEYADYVDVKFDKSKVEVTQKKDLLELKKDTLVLTFVVTDAKDAVAGSAVLVVAMKMDVEEASPDSGLVAGIAVLGSLLALFIIASFAFWYFKLRKRSAPYGNMMEDRKD